MDTPLTFCLLHSATAWDSDFMSKNVYRAVVIFRQCQQLSHVICLDGTHLFARRMNWWICQWCLVKSFIQVLRLCWCWSSITMRENGLYSGGRGCFSLPSVTGSCFNPAISGQLVNLCSLSRSSFSTIWSINHFQWFQLPDSRFQLLKCEHFL